MTNLRKAATDSKKRAKLNNTIKVKQEYLTMEVTDKILNFLWENLGFEIFYNGPGGLYEKTKDIKDLAMIKSAPIKNLVAQLVFNDKVAIIQLFSTLSKDPIYMGETFIYKDLADEDNSVMRSNALFENESGWLFHNIDEKDSPDLVDIDDFLESFLDKESINDISKALWEDLSKKILEIYLV